MKQTSKNRTSTAPAPRRPASRRFGAWVGLLTVLAFVLAACQTAAPPAPSITAGTPSFNGFGNTVLVEGSGSLLAEASHPDGDPLSVEAETTTASDGGTVVIASDGSFTYTPSAGSTGAVTFDFTVTDGIVTATGTSTLNLDGLIWYVDNSALAGGNGISSAPFQTIASGVAEAASGDIVFVRQGSGSYGAGVTLTDGVSLIGSGVALMVGGAEVEPASAKPTLDADATLATAAVLVADNNTVSGFTFEGSGASDVHGIQAENLAVAQTNLTVSNNTFTGYDWSATERAIQIVELNGLRLEANVFTNVTAVTGAGSVVELTNLTGTVDILTNEFTDIAANLVTVTSDDTAALTLTIEGNAFAPILHTGTQNAITIFVNESDDVTASITNNEFAGIGFESLRIDATGPGAATIAATVSGNTFGNGFLGVVLDADQNHTMRALVENNTFNAMKSSAVTADIDGNEPEGATVLDATVRGNTLTDIGVSQDEDAISASVFHDVDAGQTLRILVDNNSVSGVGGAGFSATSDVAAGTNLLAVTLLNNDFLLTDERQDGTDSVILSSASSATICVDADGNEVTDDLGAEGTYLLAQVATSTFQAEMASSTTAFEGNQVNGTATFSGTITDVADGTCQEPTAP